MESDFTNFGKPDVAPVHLANTGASSTILIADDSPEFLVYLSYYLKEKFHLIQCSDGLEAWEKCLEVVPDLVISDIVMPRMSGIQLCSKIKQHEQTNHIPVIILTANHSESILIEGLESKADHYLVKPFNIRELLLRISNLLDLRETMREKFAGAGHEIGGLTANKLGETFILKLARIIEANISDTSFGVDDLSREIGISRAALYKKLKEITGKSVNDFTKDIRIRQAAKLLKGGAYNVNEVAEMVGFSDRRYFSKEFRKIYDKVPSQYAAEWKVARHKNNT